MINTLPIVNKTSVADKLLRSIVPCTSPLTTRADPRLPAIGTARCWSPCAWPARAGRRCPASPRPRPPGHGDCLRGRPPCARSTDTSAGRGAAGQWPPGLDPGPVRRSVRTTRRRSWMPFSASASGSTSRTFGARTSRMSRTIIRSSWRLRVMRRAVNLDLQICKRRFGTGAHGCCGASVSTGLAPHSVDDDADFLRDRDRTCIESDSKLICLKSNLLGFCKVAYPSAC